MFGLNLNVIPILFHLLVSLLNLRDDFSLGRRLINLFTESLLRFSVETLSFFHSFLPAERFFLRLLSTFKFCRPWQLSRICGVSRRLLLKFKLTRIIWLPPSFPRTGLRRKSFLCADGTSWHRREGNHRICFWGLRRWSKAFSVCIGLGKLWLLSSFSRQIARIIALIQIHFN